MGDQFVAYSLFQSDGFELRQRFDVLPFRRKAIFLRHCCSTASTVFSVGVESIGQLSYALFGAAQDAVATFDEQFVGRGEQLEEGPAYNLAVCR